LLYEQNKIVAQNIRGFVERRLRAAQRVLGSHMWPSEPRMRTTALKCVLSGIKIYSPCSMFIRFLFFFSLCLFDVQLLFLNTCQKMINGVSRLDDRHGLSPILYDTAPLFVYTDQLLCHCFSICSKVR